MYNYEKSAKCHPEQISYTDNLCKNCFENNIKYNTPVYCEPEFEEIGKIYPYETDYPNHKQNIIVRFFKKISAWWNKNESIVTRHYGTARKIIENNQYPPDFKPIEQYFKDKNN